MLPSVQTIPTYEDALLAEREGRFNEALELFRACLENSEYEAGEVNFHCGWCLEQLPMVDLRDVVFYYQKGAGSATSPSCKMNNLFRAGWVLMQMKEHSKAALQFRQALEYGDFAGMKTEIYLNSMFWYGVCLESQSWYLDALKWYRCVETLSPTLGPESMYRQIICLNHVGLYEDALRACCRFDNPAPHGFDRHRYEELGALAKRERELLRACLAPIPQKGAVPRAGN